MKTTRTLNSVAILALVTASESGMTAPQVARSLGFSVTGEERMCDGSDVDAIDGILCEAVTAKIIAARQVAFFEEWATYGTDAALKIDSFNPSVRIST